VLLYFKLQCYLYDYLFAIIAQTRTRPHNDCKHIELVHDAGNKASDMAIVPQLTLLVTRPKGVRSTYYRLTPGRTFTAISNNNYRPTLYQPCHTICQYRRQSLIV